MCTPGPQSDHVIGRRFARIVGWVAGINFERRVAARIDVCVIRQVELHVERTRGVVPLIEDLERGRGHARTEQIIGIDVETGTQQVDLGNDAVAPNGFDQIVAHRVLDVVRI